MIKVKKVRMLERGMLLYKDADGNNQWIFRPETTFVQSLYSLVMSPVTFEGEKVGYVDQIYIEDDTCFADVFVDSGLEGYLERRDFRVKSAVYFSNAEEYLIETNRNNIEIRLDDKSSYGYERVYDE